MDVYEAMEKTDPARIGTVEPGSEEERAAISRFTDFVSVMSPEIAREKTLSVYAENAYLNDTLAQITGAEAIRDYFVSSLGGAESVTVEVTDVAVSNGNYYFRWIMDIQYKKLKKGEVTRSVGMSHIRFDREGKVIFHNDYWDSTSGFFEHVPVVGWLIGKVKARVH
ncbi:nuclear transport factor 2 family protein [Candidatus Latescibacterota bacterium]